MPFARFSSFRRCFSSRRSRISRFSCRICSSTSRCAACTAARAARSFIRWSHDGLSPLPHFDTLIVEDAAPVFAVFHGRVLPIVRVGGYDDDFEISEIARGSRLIQGSPGDWVARFSRSNHWSTASPPQPDHRIDDGHRAAQMVGTDRPTDP